MTRAAEWVSLRAPPGASGDDAAARAEAIARHLVGATIDAGARVALPGWPTFVVDETRPEGPVAVGPDTRVETWWPPARPPGPSDVLFVVDASFTMAQGPPGYTRMEKAVWIIESVLLRAQHAVRRAGLLVFGAEPRLTSAPLPPEEFNPHVAHRAPLRGTFHHAAAVAAATGLSLAEAHDEKAPAARDIVLITDGEGLPGRAATVAAAAARHGISLHVVLVGGTMSVPEAAARIAAEGGGVAAADPEPVIQFLAGTAGVPVVLREVAPPAPLRPGQDDFEVVIETIDEARP